MRSAMQGLSDEDRRRLLQTLLAEASGVGIIEWKKW
jgi:hypothetical protein